jgi:superfamily II RNA helicase
MQAKDVRQAAAADLRARFVASLGFELDPFQARALDALDAGQSVVVAAPTGSGKTVVGEYAVVKALAAGRKAFYTTPLKALSNQKYGDLVRAHGADRVGLLTGDNSINGDAPVVVMTTEVLRNMIYARSPSLRALRYIVLDEVHYLQDAYRGPVWEEVIIHAPADAGLVCLSATVSNAEQLTDWISTVRGGTQAVVEDRRPVELHNLYLVGDRFAERLLFFPTFVGGRPNREAAALDGQAVRYPGQRGRVRGRLFTPRRGEVVELLRDEAMLPAIYFIFSRLGCDEAVRQCVRQGLRLTTPDERRQIRSIVEAKAEALTDEDLRVLDYGTWISGLEAGFAGHHAGMVPPFKEAVEKCFAAALVKVVFATETLSLGINMPARTVVIERFTKFGGSGRAPLTSGEYTQLTGRAGRRGLDAEGHSVVAWSPETAIADVARVATASPPDLRSAFRPTYNLAVNLIRRFDRADALELLRRSFAQWQAAPSDSDGANPHGLAELLGRRLAVLEELGYLDGWRLTVAGSQLSRLYHASDLLVAEAIGSGVLDGAEPSVLAGVTSAFVFERRRARRVGTGRGRGPTRGGSGHGRPIASPAPASGRRRVQGGDRLGEQRRRDLGNRLARLEELATRVRGLEEVHLVPRTRQPEIGLAGAVASWARGAPLVTALDVAVRDAGEIAPGDFVRTVKEVADLVGQVAHVAPDPVTAAAATEALPMLIRGVTAGGIPASANLRAAWS